MNGCSPKAWKSTKAILVGLGREGDGENGDWEQQFRSGEGDLEGFFFPDSLQRKKEISVVC